ncbi:TonB-dependent receptor [Exilibacterium tricleocarpae]|uniref:TonB-dependent receptor n=1 Tax=Exilibacterium tricleocarpae TaxID=2591008 RepID=A0A545TVE7_9GAMM|nr:TonB-dependent receptor [Exilibacterium tricleocarpae]TQV81190.1 TonB-dependent receptor [Exilibacterium tricleocarpae]
MSSKKLLARHMAAVTAAAALLPGPAGADTGAFELEEIVVTAQKREQNLQDVGISVTAIDSQAMSRAGIEDVSRLELVTPGVSYGFIGSDAKIAIRGANSNNTFADNSSIAGFFIDGVYRPRASQQSQAYFDVERIEVLKGPQGTLYGRNTFAGAVNLYTRRPDTEALSGGLKTSFSRFSKFTTEAFINAPVNDELALRFAINTKDSDGWIENRGDGEDYGQDDALNYRASLLWTPADNLEVLVRYTSLSEEGITAGIFAAEGICQPVNENGITDAFGRFVNCDNPYPGSDGDSFFDEPYEVATDVDAKRDNEEENITLDIGWDIGDSLTLRSITSYTEFDSEFDWDGDWSNVPGYVFYWDEEVESVTQEVQLSSDNDGPFTWTAGLYYSVDDIGFGFSQYRVAPFPFSDFADFQEIETTTKGAFFQGEYALTDTLRLIAGVRNNEEEKDTKTFAGASTDAGGDPLPGVNPTSLDGRPRDLYRYTLREDRSAVREFDIVTWKAGAEWDATDNVMVYGNVSTGFLSGGVNSDGSPFEQQESKAFEVGFKSRWADNTLQLNVAAYRNEFTNLTTQELIQLGGADVTITVNGGEIDAQGLEVELVWLPTEKWLISAGASFMDSEFGKFGVANPFEQANGVEQAFLDLKGDTPPWSPDMTLSVSVGYDIDLGDMGRLTPFLQTYYSDEYSTDDVVTYRTQRQDAYSKTDLRLIWTSLSEKLSAEVFIENAEDEEVLARTNVGGFDLVQSSYLYPRNYGVKFNYNF